MKFTLAIILGAVFLLTGTYAIAATDNPLAQNIKVKLVASRATTYLGKILLNPTESTDGTVKRAYTVTQTCQDGMVMQGFNAKDGKIICVPVTSGATTTSTTVAAAAPVSSTTAPKDSTLNEKHDCVASANGDDYFISCVTDLGKICIYAAPKKVTQWNWFCGSPAGYDIPEKELTSCVGRMSDSSAGHYNISIVCTSNKWRICEINTATNKNIQWTLNPNDWTCTTIKFPDTLYK